MHILAIDPATTTGFARYKSPERGEDRDLGCGSIEFDTQIWMFSSQYRKWLTNQIKGHQITHVAFEAWLMPMPKLVNGKMRTTTTPDIARKMACLNVHTWELAKHLGCQPIEINQQTWRSFFLCGHTAPKSERAAGKLSDWYKQAVAEKAKRLGWTFENHNESDAIGILSYARAQLDPAYAASFTQLFEGLAS